MTGLLRVVTLRDVIALSMWCRCITVLSGLVMSMLVAGSASLNLRIMLLWRPVGVVLHLLRGMPTVVATLGWRLDCR